MVPIVPFEDYGVSEYDKAASPPLTQPNLQFIGVHAAEAGPARAGGEHERCRGVRAGVGALCGPGVDWLFVWLLGAFALTSLVFLGLARQRPLELDRAQVDDFERRARVLANSSPYIVEAARPEGLVARLSPADWHRILRNIDFVAVVYDDLPAFLVEDWVRQAELVLKGRPMREAEAGVGIVLFACRCAVPNRLFQLVQHRMGGMESLLLPGFVLDKEDVHWVDTTAGGKCRRRESILGGRVLGKYAHQLQNLRATVMGWKASLNSTIRTEGKVLGAGGEQIGRRTAGEGVKSASA